MSAAPAVILGRCNPYGAETGGPRHVLGGLYGPNSARTEGMYLPENVAQGEWRCDQPAVIRCRMMCQCGHRGQLMQLCSWRDDVVRHGEFVAGVTRQVAETVRQRGHFEEIQRRQADLCPPCAYPAPYAELAKEVQQWQAEMSMLWNVPTEYAIRRVRALKQYTEDAGHLMDAAIAQGIIHRCPLTLVPVS